MNTAGEQLFAKMCALIPPRREGRPPPLALTELRLAGERAMAASVIETGVSVRSQIIGGITCVVCSPASATGTIIHAHGGGFRLGSASAWTGFGSRLALHCGFEVVLPEYGLAPECPFPGAIHEMSRVYAELAAAQGSARLVLSGDSAGGALAMSVALLAGALGIAPAAAMLFSPWLDLTVHGATFATRAPSDALFSRSSAEAAAEMYLQGWQATDPIASPRYGALEHAPHTLILTSSAEVLLDDSLDMARALALARRPVDLHVFVEEPHDWPVLAPKTQATGRAFDIVRAFTCLIFQDGGGV
jgi:monoterpene epsilon-lactone hydrolase